MCASVLSAPSSTQPPSCEPAAAPVADATNRPTSPVVSTVALWSPLHVVIVSVVFSCGAGLLLAIVNWHRMAMLPQRRWLVAGLAAAIVAFVTIGLLVQAQLVALLGNLAVGFYLKRQLEHDFAGFAATARGVEPPRWWVTALLAVAGLLAFAVLVYGEALLLALLGII